MSLKQKKIIKGPPGVAEEAGGVAEGDGERGRTGEEGGKGEKKTCLWMSFHMDLESICWPAQQNVEQ